MNRRPGRHTKIKLNEIYGCWTVIEKGSNSTTVHGHPTHLCRCRCGNVKEVINAQLFHRPNLFCTKCHGKKVTVKGLGTGTLPKLSAKAGIKYSTVLRRVKQGWTLKRALSLKPIACIIKTSEQNKNTVNNIFSGMFADKGNIDEVQDTTEKRQVHKSRV